VIDFDVITGDRSSVLWVYLKNGKKLKFSGLLSDFDQLVGMVNSHMEGLPGPHHDSPAKIHDQQKRKRDNRIAVWYGVVGILMLAAFLSFLWRMQLLN
jgi:hypothetical protein